MITWTRGKYFKKNMHANRENLGKGTNELLGAMYPNVPANEVWFNESGFKNLAVPKSEMWASYSKSNK